MLFAGGDRQLLKRKSATKSRSSFDSFGVSRRQKGGRSSLASVKKERRARDAARRDERQRRAAETQRNSAAVIIQSGARSRLARRSLFQSLLAWCHECLDKGSCEIPAVLRAIVWCQRFLMNSQRQDVFAQDSADKVVVLFSNYIASAHKISETLESKLVPHYLNIFFLQICIRLLKRSQNLKVMPVLKEMLAHPISTPIFCAEIVTGCLPSIFQVGLILGLCETHNGLTICKIVIRALKHTPSLKITAPYFLARWLTKPDTGSSLNLPSYDVKIFSLLEYIQEAEIMIDGDSSAAHTLTLNLLEMLSMNKMMAHSFNIYARGLFWKVAINALELGSDGHGKRTKEEPCSLPEYRENGEIYESTFDLEAEFDISQSQRIYASVCHHHNQICLQSFKLDENDKDAINKHGLVSQFFLDSGKWSRLAKEDVSNDTPMLVWSIPLAILTARYGRQPNIAKLLENLRPAKKSMLTQESSTLPAVPRLKRLFPDVEEDVCALVYANSNRNFEEAVKIMSQMTNMNSIRPSSVLREGNRISDIEDMSSSATSSLPIAFELSIISLWEALNRCCGYSATRIVGDRSLRKVFPAVHYACYLFVVLLFDDLSRLDNDAFDDPENHSLSHGTHLSDVVIFLQILIGSLQENSNETRLDPLTPYMLNACHALYTLLLHHHKRKPWIRNTSDIIDVDMKSALEADRRLRAEQDADFAAALEHDKLQANKAKEIQDVKEAELQGEMEALRAREEEASQWQVSLKSKQERVKLAHEALLKNQGEDTIAIRLRFPTGKAQTLRLLATEKMSIIFDFVEVHLDTEKPTAFDLVRTHPQRRFELNDTVTLEKTLRELELSRSTLLVKILDA